MLIWCFRLVLGVLSILVDEGITLQIAPYATSPP
jgi:hypothetical protein